MVAKNQQSDDSFYFDAILEKNAQTKLRYQCSGWPNWQKQVAYDQSDLI